MTRRQLSYLACAALAIGSLGPWQTSHSGAGWGLEGGGLYTLAIAAIAALLPIPRRPWPAVVAALGLLAALVAGVNAVEIAGQTREPAGLQPSSVEVDWGLWLTLLAALALFATTVPRMRVRVRSRVDPAVLGLLFLLAVGLLLRVWLTIAWSPAFTGYSDSGIYFQGAFESVWSDPIRMAGYAMFLHGLHALTPHLLAVVVVQHGLGLAAAALVFFAVRRCGGPGSLGLVPAAMIALGGDQLFLEHAALSDALFVFLIVATLYATVRADAGPLWWAALAGALAGLAVWDRTVGLGLVAIVAVWLACSHGRPNRRGLAVGGLALLVALATVGAYAVWRSAAADLPGTLTSNNAWNLYGRVAPWADCEEFAPPVGTAGLCQATPFAERGWHSGEEYIYSPESPAQLLYGPPFLISPDPDAMVEMRKWSQAALRGQPLDYLNAVWLDTRRLFSPGAPAYGDLTADAFVAYLLHGVNRSDENEFVESWQSQLYPDDPQPRRGDLGPFLAWEALTRVVNLWMALGLALCLASPWTLRGRPRAGAILFGATALMLLFFPIVSKSYDYRFVIPASAPLVAAATLSAWGLASRVANRRRHPDPATAL